MESLSYNKLSEVEDYDDPEVAEIVRDTFRHESHLFSADLPSAVLSPKYWKTAMAVRALRHFGALRADATILCASAGVEVLPFYLAGHVGQVVAIDRYLSPAAWRADQPSFMLTSPEDAAPYAFDRQRLTVQHMDGRALRYADNSFDAVVALRGIEDLGGLEYIANTAYELGRVLKPGGILSLTTQYRIYGPPGGVGWPGCLLFSRQDLQHYLVEASGLQPVDQLQTELSEQTLRSKRDLLTYAVAGRIAAGQDGRYTYIHEIPWSSHAALIHVHQGYVFCSVQLTLQKQERYPAAINGWAKPSLSTLEAADAHVAQHSPATSNHILYEPMGSRIETSMNDSNNAELVTVRNLLAAWDGARIRGWYNLNLRRLPFGLAKAGRTMVRIMQLGRIFEAQAQLYGAMINHQDHLGTHLGQLSAQLAALESQVGGISGQTGTLQAQAQQLAELNARLGDLNLVLARLDTQTHATTQQLSEHQAHMHSQLQDIAERQARLEAQLQESTARQTDLDHQLRLNTSYIRLFQQQFKADSHDELASADANGIRSTELIELIQTLEQASPELAQAAAVELSIQDGMAEDTLIEGAAYFGERMSSAGESYRVPNDACYHIDLTNDWARQGLLASAVSRLQSGGTLAIVTAPENDSPSSMEQLEPIDDRMITLASGRQLRAYLWRRV